MARKKLVLNNFPAFRRKVFVRLTEGEKEYGNKSFSWDHLTLLEEIKEEILDICGWSYILYERLSGIEKHLSASLLPSESEDPAAEDTD